MSSTLNAFGNHGKWSQGEGSLTLTTNITTMHLTTYAISFNLTNPAVSQPSPTVSISCSIESGHFDSAISFTKMLKSNLPAYGVVNGSNPLEVLKPQFIFRSLEQKVVYANVLNTLTASLSTNFDLAAGSTITIQGLTGAQTLDTDLDIISTGQALGIKAQWLQDSGRLVLTVHASAMVSANSAYVVEYNLTNPGLDKQSPVVEISARIDHGNGMLVGYITPANVTKLHSELMGIMNGSDPFQIVLPRFEMKTIEQSAPFAAVLNTLTVSLKANCDWVADSTITVFGLKGSPFVNTTLGLMTANGGLSNKGTLMSNGRLLLTSIGMKAHEIYEIRFNLTNPVSAQSSPAVSIRAGVKSVYGDISPVVATVTMKKGQELLGVPNGTDPLEVLVPAFDIKTIEQNTPLAAVVNTITVTLKANCDLLPGSTVTIFGLSGSRSQSTGVLEIIDSKQGFASIGDWDSSGNLTLTTAAHMGRRLVYEARFNLTNPVSAQSSPAVSIRAGVKSVYGDISPVVATVTMKKGQELLGVPNGTDPLEVLVPAFDIKTIEQNTPLAAVVNTITVTLKANCDLLPGSTVTLSDMTGASTQDGAVDLHVLPPEIQIPSFQSKGSWLQEPGNLTLTSLGIKRRDTHTIVFNITNQNIDQESPLVVAIISAKSVFGHLSQNVEVLGKPSSNLLGVPFGRHPLKLIRPDFITKQILQSHPLPLSSNRISFIIQTNCDFAVGSVITIAGLTGSNTPDETGISVAGGYYDDWFDQTLTVWLQEPGVLKLQVTTFFIVDNCIERLIACQT